MNLCIGSLYTKLISGMDFVCESGSASLILTLPPFLIVMILSVDI